jgi:hypothetical protein
VRASALKVTQLSVPNLYVTLTHKIKIPLALSQAINYHQITVSNFAFVLTEGHLGNTYFVRSFVGLKIPIAFLA